MSWPSSLSRRLTRCTRRSGWIEGIDWIIGELDGSQRLNYLSAEGQKNIKGTEFTVPLLFNTLRSLIPDGACDFWWLFLFLTAERWTEKGDEPPSLLRRTTRKRFLSSCGSFFKALSGDLPPWSHGKPVQLSWRCKNSAIPPSSALFGLPRRPLSRGHWHPFICRCRFARG